MSCNNTSRSNESCHRSCNGETFSNDNSCHNTCSNEDSCHSTCSNDNSSCTSFSNNRCSNNCRSAYRCINRNTRNKECYNGRNFADIQYALHLASDNCRGNSSSRGIRNHESSFCDRGSCCGRPNIKCKPIKLGCQESVEYRLCTDPNGCAYLYPCECRDPFWPEFSHPRGLCCSRLYRRCAEISDDCCDR